MAARFYSPQLDKKNASGWWAVDAINKKFVHLPDAHTEGQAQELCTEMNSLDLDDLFLPEVVEFGNDLEKGLIW